MINSIKTNFNNLITSYPHVEEFSKQVLAGSITRKILAGYPPSNDLDAKTIRSFAKKFKQIIIGIKQDELSVALKANTLIKKFKNCAIPDSPFLKELQPFLNTLQESLRNDPQLRPVLRSFDLLQYSFLLDKEDIRFIDTYFQPNEFVLNLCSRKLEEQTTETAAIIELCHLIRRNFDPQLATSAVETVRRYYEKCRAINIIFKVCDSRSTVWDELFKKFQNNSEALAVLLFLADDKMREIIWELVQTFDPSEIDKFVLILQVLSKIFGQWAVFDEFFRENDRWKQCSKSLLLFVHFWIFSQVQGDQVFIWKTITQDQNEIKFLSLLGRRQASSLRKEIDLLAESPKRSPEDLAVLCYFLKSSKRKYVWEELILKKGNTHVIAFLSKVGQPGAVSVEKFQKSITKEYKTELYGSDRQGGTK